MRGARQKKPHHDMGGDLCGPVVPDRPDDPMFDKPRHRRVLGVTVAAGAMGAWSIDMSRFWRESLPKKDYQSFSYYEKWLAALTNLLVLKGYVSREELMRGYQGPLRPIADGVLRGPDVAAMLARGAAASRASVCAPKFCIGDRVRTKAAADTVLQVPGHTRLPHYAANRVGRILFHHGHHVLPNSNAHGLGECPEPLYSVEFLATELWPERAEKDGDTVIVDCWESYLDRVD